MALYVNIHAFRHVCIKRIICFCENRVPQIYRHGRDDGDVDSSVGSRTGEKDDFKICFGRTVDRTHDIIVKKEETSVHPSTCVKSRWLEKIFKF